MSNVYGPEHRALQDQFDTRRMADLLEGGFIAKEVDANNKAFIESRDMFFLSTIDTHGQEVQVDVYDPSFFVAFGFATEAPVKLSGSAIKGCTAEVKKPDPESEEDAKALSEAFFSQLGPNSNFGSQFAQTVMVKCSDAHL